MAENRSPACDGRKKKLGRQQKAVAAITKVLCREKFPNRGVLVYHAVGSGKTCSCVAAMDMVWSSKKRKIVYVTSVEGLVSNPPANFYDCAQMIARFKGKSREDIEAAFVSRKVEFLSFAQLAHVLQLHRPRKTESEDQAELMRRHLRGALLIVDEVHSLLTPLPGQGKECAALLKFLQTADDERTLGMKVLLMTATPGDSVRDVLKLLNVVKRPGSDELTEKNVFEPRRLKGLVSFYDAGADRTRFPRVTEVAHSMDMSLDQALELSKKVTDDRLDVAESDTRAEIRKKWLPARRYSNTLFKWPKGASIETFSAKMAALLATIRKYPDEKHLVYSAFNERRGYGGHGARAIIKALIEHRGYTDVLGSEPAKRVALLARGQPVIKIKKAFNDPEDNPRGQTLQVLVLTQGFGESLDLHGVRHVHVFDPLTSAEDQKQLVGRGVRMCSHAALDYPKEWTVTVHRYESRVPDVSALLSDSNAAVKDASNRAIAIEDELDTLKGIRGVRAVTARRDRLKTLAKNVKAALKIEQDDGKRLGDIESAPNVDSQVYEMASKRAAKVEKLLRVMRDSAIDCEIFEAFHKKGDVPVKCK
jgi:hypothetical protein